MAEKRMTKKAEVVNMMNWKYSVNQKVFVSRLQNWAEDVGGKL